MVAGTYLHGMFELPEARDALLRALANTRGFALGPALPVQPDPYADLARVLADTLRLETTRVPALISTRVSK
jgi:cobyric acid synthase